MIVGSFSLVLIAWCSLLVTSLEISERTPARDTHLYVENGEGRASMPDIVRLDIELEGEGEARDALRLNLVRQKDALPSVTLSPAEPHGQYTEWRPSEHLATYRDEALDAFGIIAFSENAGNMETFCTISFRHGKSFYNLLPEAHISGDAWVKEKANAALVKIDGRSHLLFDFVRPNPLFGSSLEAASKMRSKRSSVEVAKKKKTTTVNVYTLIDYSMFERYMKVSKESYDHEKSRDALSMVIYLMSVVMQGVNDVYKKIENEDSKFVVRWIGSFVAKTAESLPFLANVTLTKDSVDAREYLDLLKKWSNEARNGDNRSSLKLPNYDHLLAFTSYKLIDSENADQIGMSYVGGVCSPSNVGLVQFGTVYSTIGAVALELGINLGSPLDGSKKSENFVPGETAAHVEMSRLYSMNVISKCTLSKITNHLLKLEKQKNCLLNGQTEDEDPNVEFFRSKPGRVYTLDEQCRMARGPNSFYCGRKKDVCKVLSCATEDGGSCETVPFLSAMEGTSCSNRSWCASGKCVPHPDAPRTPDDSCLNGDSKFPQVFNDRAYTCAELVAKNPDVCSREPYKKACCASCTGSRIAGKTCMDTVDYCPLLDSSDCYNNYFSRVCCRSCRRFIDEVSNFRCLYGDRGKDCHLLHPKICNTGTNYCCKTCAREE